MGFEAAGLKDALERFDDTQRKQAVETMLSRGLRGVELVSLAVEGESEVGGPATAVYGMRVQLARKDGPQLFVPASLLPQRLARRFMQRAERALPLLVESTEKQTTRAEIVLPQGFHLRSPPAPVSLRTPFGELTFRAREEHGRIVVEEAFVMPRQRVTPAQYSQFADFARRVDDAEGFAETFYDGERRFRPLGAAKRSGILLRTLPARPRYRQPAAGYRRAPHHGGQMDEGPGLRGQLP